LSIAKVSVQHNRGSWILLAHCFCCLRQVAAGQRSKTEVSACFTSGDGQHVTCLVVSDLERRKVVSLKKYGVPLRANNGRNALIDAYQEALDLALYLRQAIAEQCNE
jgi:hypothetical protein